MVWAILLYKHFGQHFSMTLAEDELFKTVIEDINRAGFQPIGGRRGIGEGEIDTICGRVNELRKKLDGKVPVDLMSELRELSFAPLNGPYFKGQSPSECGHFYPDVLAEADLKTPIGEYMRILNCRYCGRSEMPINPAYWSPTLIRDLDHCGSVVNFDTTELPKIRDQKLQELLEMQQDKD